MVTNHGLIRGPWRWRWRSKFPLAATSNCHHTRSLSDSHPMTDGSVRRPSAASALRLLGEWAAALRFEDLPEDVVHCAKRCILDTLGVAYAGSTTTTAGLCREHAARAYAPGSCTVIGSGEALAATGATFSNAVAAHALDFDDTSYAGILHSSALVLPAVLATCEERDLSGKDLLVSFVAGTEVELALGLALGHEPYLRGWLVTSVLGAVGAAAGAARAFGLAAAGVEAALALAAGQTGGLQSCLGSPAKPYYAGRASNAGLTAATLAALGLADVGDTFERPHGFLDLFAEGRFSESMLARLGASYSLLDPGVCFKCYPVCSAAQAAVEGLELILARDLVGRDEVARVICKVPPLVVRNLCFDRPSTVAEAQFSLPFAIGAVLACGSLSPKSLSAEVLASRELQRASAKVQTIVAGDDYDWAGGSEGAEVTVVTADGRSLTERVPHARGSSVRPMSDRDLEGKARSCVSDGLGVAATQAFIERLWTLERVGRAGELVEPLGGRIDWPTGAARQSER